MTDDEKRQQKAMLLLDYQEAVENLAHLREKAGRFVAPIEEIALWIGPHRKVIPGYRENEAARNANIRANLDLYRKALNFDDALSLMDEVESAVELVKQLGQRKTELGLK